MYAATWDAFIKNFFLTTIKNFSHNYKKLFFAMKKKKKKKITKIKNKFFVFCHGIA